MRPYGYLLVIMGLYRYLKISKRTYGSLWVVICPYGLLCVLMGRYRSL